MLWDAGQARLNREHQSHLTDLYVGVRDGYVAGAVAIGQAKARRDIRPAYVRASTPKPSTGGQYATLSRLAALFPDAISRRGDS